MKLKTYLETTKTSQKTLAEEINVTQAAISRYVQGLRFPDRETILKIEKATKGRVKPRDWFADDEAAA